VGWANPPVHAGGAILSGQHHMKRFLSKFWADESGATAIEYGLIAASISIVIVVVVNGSLGVTLNKKFVSINASLK